MLAEKEDIEQSGVKFVSEIKEMLEHWPLSSVFNAD
jgi:hypothetical protein